MLVFRWFCNVLNVQVLEMFCLQEEHTLSSMPPETMLTSVGTGVGSTGGGPNTTVSNGNDYVRGPNGRGRGGRGRNGRGRGAGRGPNNRGPSAPPADPAYRPNGTVPPQTHQNPKTFDTSKYPPPSTLAVIPGGSAPEMPPHLVKQHHNPGAFAMPANGEEIVESPEPQGDESTPMLGATASPTKTGPRSPSYNEPLATTPVAGAAAGTTSGIHTPSEAGSPSHEASSPMEPLVVNGLPVTMAGLRPVSQPPSYEDVLREDHRRHPGAIGGFGTGVLRDDDHFEARCSDSDWYTYKIHYTTTTNCVSYVC